jgi:hypothetical protein
VPGRGGACSHAELIWGAWGAPRRCRARPRCYSSRPGWAALWAPCRTLWGSKRSARRAQAQACLLSVRAKARGDIASERGVTHEMAAGQVLSLEVTGVPGEVRV